MGACLTSPTSIESQRAACGEPPGDASERCRKRLSTYFAVMKSSCMVTGSMSVTVVHGLPPQACFYQIAGGKHLCDEASNSEKMYRRCKYVHR